MNMIEIEKQIYRQLEAGLIHHSYDNEKRAYALLSMDPEELAAALQTASLQESVEMYGPLLGPTRVRSIKNGLICYLTLVCRFAIQYGVEPEFSYALSDYYINTIESLRTEKELLGLLKDLTVHYNSLIHRNKIIAYSKPVTFALRYMHQHLYTRVRIQEIADALGLEVHYFSQLFKQETGTSPGQYMTQLKMTEAARLLSLRENSVTYVANTLGYNDTAHFSKTFKKAYGISPKRYSMQDQGVL